MSFSLLQVCGSVAQSLVGNSGVAAILNLVAIIALRLITSIFFLGPEFGAIRIDAKILYIQIVSNTGPFCYCLSYFSHVCVFAHSVLKALQIINRFTALFLPLRHDNVSFSSGLANVMFRKSDSNRLHFDVAFHRSGHHEQSG